MTVVECLEAEGLVYGYTRRLPPVLRGVSLRACQGEVVAVLGPTGSGKTTLLFLLAGLLEPWKGEVRLSGRRVGDWARPLIGILFQDPREQLFNPTVLDEIAYTLRALGADDAEEKARRVAERLGLGGLLDRNPLRLSVGQQKLVALAAAIAHEPRVLLLDEPTANLDRRGYMALSRVIRETVARGGIVVASTHDADFVLEHAERLYVIDRGRISLQGNTLHLVAKGALEETPLPIPLGLRLLARQQGWRSVAEAIARLREEGGLLGHAANG